MVCFLRRSVSLDTPKRYYMPSISDREGGWSREVEGVECNMFVARALGVIYPTPALQMLLLGDSRPHRGEDQSRNFVPLGYEILRLSSIH